MSAGNDRVFARALVAAMNDDVGQAPEEVLTRVLGETERARPLPRLVALVVEPPIVMPARVVVGIRRSRLLMVAAALLIATSLVATGIAGAWVERLTMPNEPPDALERLQSIGVMRVAIAPERAGDGFETDVGRALAERLGLSVEVVPVSSAELAGSSAWDVALPTISESTLDRDDFAVTEPYYAWPRVVLVPVASGGTSLADVQGQPICAVAGDLGQRWLMGSLGNPGPSPFSNPPLPSAMILRDNDAACIAALEDGTVRAVVTATLSPADLTARPDLRSVASLPAESRAAAVPRDGPDPSTLVAAIEAAVDDMRRDGTLTQLSTARFGKDLSEVPR